MSQTESQIIPKDTILPKEMKGVMYLSGEKGIGKSYLAAQCDLPENVAFFDMESKGEGIHEQLNFGLYRALTDECAAKYGADYKPLQLYALIKEAFEKLEKDKYTVAVIDNITPFEEALVAEVKKMPVAYGVNPSNAQSGAFGGAYVGASTLIGGFCKLLHSKGIKLIIVIAHLKNVWSSAGIVPNKFKPSGLERWHQLSILSLILIPGEHLPTPSAVVYKEQLGSLVFNRETRKHEIHRRLPLRIPECTFEAIREYLEHPADLSNPKEGEVPTSKESDPFSDRFSREALNLMMAMAKAAGHDGGVTIPQIEPRAVKAANNLADKATPANTK